MQEETSTMQVRTSLSDDEDDDDFDIAALIAEQVRRTAANFAAALGWCARGYNVVPQKAPSIKHPAVRWKELQTRKATRGELQSWCAMFLGGVGFITGEVSESVRKLSFEMSREIPSRNNSAILGKLCFPGDVADAPLQVRCYAPI